MAGRGDKSRDDGMISREERLRLILAHREEVNPDLLLTDYEVAAMLNCSLMFLRDGRKDGRRKGKVLDLPPHKVIFGRMIRYRYGDVVAWIQRRDGEEKAA